MKIQKAHLLENQGDSPISQESDIGNESIILNEIQLILAEKRTSLSTMRTGIAVFVLPLSVLSVLIATSKYYNVLNVIHLIIPLLAICGVLVFLGSYLIIRAVIRMRHHDNLITQLKRKHRWIAEFVD
jgi:uncharacterized membrane protein YkgB